MKKINFKVLCVQILIWAVALAVGAGAIMVITKFVEDILAIILTVAVAVVLIYGAEVLAVEYKVNHE